MTSIMEFDVKSVLGIVAGVIAFIAYIIYVIAILKGESKPNRATWFIWTFVGLILAASYYYSGAGNTIWVPFMEFIGPLIVALLSIKYGEGGLTDKTDLICLFGAVASLILWGVFDSPVVALITNLAVDAFALIPTIKKSYLRPEGEDFWAWFGTGTADTMNLFAIERFTFGVMAYPIYMLALDLVIILLLSRGKIKSFGRLHVQNIVKQTSRKFHLKNE
ncbi:MAG: hypothetical protein WCF94_03570 [bacterium]